eukprot:3308082-Amphidinium_carterae.1
MHRLQEPSKPGMSAISGPMCSCMAGGHRPSKIRLFQSSRALEDGQNLMFIWNMETHCAPTRAFPHTLTDGAFWSAAALTACCPSQTACYLSRSPNLLAACAIVSPDLNCALLFASSIPASGRVASASAPLSLT